MNESLAELELLFWSTARGRLDASAVRGAFVGDVRLDACARMAIYRDMYFARQSAALAAGFPLLARALGDEAFAALVRAYLLARPSRKPAIESVGEDLPAYLEERGFSPLLVELSGLEWLRCAALIAPHDDVAGVKDVAPGAWPALKLRMVRSLAAQEVSADTLQHFMNVETPQPERREVAVWRQGFRVRALPIAEDEGGALRLAWAARPFAEICASFVDAARAYEVLHSWFQRSWVARLEVS